MSFNVAQYIKLARPQQWLKNLFILLPLFFSGQLDNLSLLGQSLVVAIGFSLIASSIYILNDCMDYKSDQEHPHKRNRPIASGKITLKSAAKYMATLTTLGLIILMITAPKTILITILYISENIFYTLKGKHIPIVDITCIAIGFCLRVWIGAIACQLQLTPWIVLLTFFLALFLGIHKRIGDTRISLKSKIKITLYTLPFLKMISGIISSVIIVIYISYTISEDTIIKMGSSTLYISSLFVVMGLMRVNYLSIQSKSSNLDPTHLLIKDAVMKWIVIGWVLSYAAVLYI